MNANKRFDWQAARTRLERARLAIEALDYSPAQIDNLYRKRAQALAAPETVTENAGERIVIFRLGAARYALPLHSVVEVIVKPRIAPAPGAPPEVVGLIQVRGEIRPVWLLQPGESKHQPANVLLLRVNGAEAGCQVDEVEDIRLVKNDDRQPVPEKSPHALWMTSDLVVVLDPAAIFPEQTEQNKRQ
jgi:purine-binding chemotaxis protein CheW